MSTVQSIGRLAAAALLFVTSDSGAAAAELKSYKDELFGYPPILSQQDNGAFVTVDYQEMRDINGRDQVPERRVKGNYISLGVRWSQHFETVEHQGRSIDIFRIGDVARAEFAVIFIHGRGGDRKLGANDTSFGGNFNRLKNLAAKNNGVYIAASARDFGDVGTVDVAALIDDISATAPNARIVLSCASMGSFICWNLTRDPTVAGQLSGMMIMGGATDPQFENSAAYARKLPMFFSHGSADSVYKAEDQIGLYKRLIARNYPVRFVLFETGTHGTPVRMTDWRDSLNWFLAK